MNLNSPYKKPAALLNELGITEPKEIDIEAIAQYCGATAIYEPLTRCEAYIIGSGECAIIAVNTNAKRTRQRFSVAHELGHWMLDREKPTTICRHWSLLNDWMDNSPEAKANTYAKDLLLPEEMFRSLATGREITFSTVKDLAQIFRVSLAVTAIRLVELGSFPAILICHSRRRREWLFRSEAVPLDINPTDWPGHATLAQRMLAGKIRGRRLLNVPAAGWIKHPNSNLYQVREDSIRLSNGLVLTLLSWANDEQLRNMLKK